MKDCLVSFGSNLGDSQKTITNALAELRERLQECETSDTFFRISDFLSTRPIGGPKDQRVFVNGVVSFQSSLEPRKILDLLHQIEKSHGRERRIRWDSRTLDLDLLIHGDTVHFEDDFQVPHPRMCFRQFVLQPAVQVAPDLVHPHCGISMKELLYCIDQREFDIVLVTSLVKARDMVDLAREFSINSPLTAVTWQDLPQMMGEPSKYKLVAFDLEQLSPAEFLQREKKVIAWQKGPILLLRNQNSKKILGELTAAIDAMKAI